MTLKVAYRSLLSRPVRTGVLVFGFGFGIAVMAALLGVGEVIVEQARSPALAGGGDAVIRGASGTVSSARFVLAHVLGSAPFDERVAAASPSRTAVVYLVGADGTTPVVARGGIPSLERELGDPETAGIARWMDAETDAAWTAPEPGDVLRAMDRFHPIPRAPRYEDSWAEWLYFNGKGRGYEFYLTFLFGPPDDRGERPAVVRLQWSRGGRVENYSAGARVDGRALLDAAPDVSVRDNRVRLDGLTYRIDLALHREREENEDASPSSRSRPPDLAGTLTLEAEPGRSIPPIAVRGMGNWVSGYVVPVLSGTLAGSIRVGDGVVDLSGGTGYHDHNWGFWRGVTWQWGQVAGDGVSVVYGRVRPPADAVDPARIPGFLGVLGEDGILGYSTDVRIEEENAPGTDRPRALDIRAAGPSVDLGLRFEVDRRLESDVAAGPLGAAGAVDFLQMRGTYRVEGRAGSREFDFTAEGAAETFRGR